MSTNAYESPFSSRYASEEMQYVFSQDNKFKTWRKLWIALAKAEKALGINITDEQIAELEANKDKINYEIAREREKLVRHDVMSHVYAYGCECPNAKGIIHLGATSCYVGDNTDVIIMREGLEIVRRKLLNVIAMLAKFAQQYKDMPCLAYTHLQPAQLTTVGKRATLWINELLMDEQEIEARIKSLKLLGSKGTTGTQASFMELFNGDEEKCKKAEQMIAQEMDRLKKTVIGASAEHQKFLEEKGSTPLKTAASLAELMCRPELSYEMLAEIDQNRKPLPAEVIEQVEIEIKYEGYIERQKRQVDQYKKMEKHKIPNWMDYDEVPSLRLEARQKLKAFRPVSVGQASRISGVSPADISVLLVYLEHESHMRDLKKE